MFRLTIALTILCLVLSACSAGAAPPLLAAALPESMPASLSAPPSTPHPAGLAPAGAPDGLSAATLAAIDAYVATQQAANQVPGLAVGILQNGHLVYASGRGVANAADPTGPPVTTQTVFRLGGVTNLLTTIAVLQLAEEGEIDLDAPIVRYLPYFMLVDRRDGDITVREILENRSGIADGKGVADMWDTFAVPDDAGAVERFVRGLFKNSPYLVAPFLRFAPGRGYEDSHLAPIILGDVVQKVAGEPFEDYVRDHIFAPLGMQHSTLLAGEVDPALLAAPHALAGGKPVPISGAPFSRAFAPVGNLYSNVEDMSRLLQALLGGGRILSSPSVRTMMAASGLTGGDEPTWIGGAARPLRIYDEYGMGGYVGAIGDRAVFHVPGAALGYRADIILCPTEKLAVIVLGNRGEHAALAYDRAGWYANTLAPDIMSLLLGSEWVAGARPSEELTAF